MKQKTSDCMDGRSGKPNTFKAYAGCIWEMHGAFLIITIIGAG